MRHLRSGASKMAEYLKLAVGQSWFEPSQIAGGETGHYVGAADSDDKKGLFTRARSLATSYFPEATISVSKIVDADDGDEYFSVSIRTELPGFAARSELQGLVALWCQKYEPEGEALFRFSLRYV